MKIFQSNSKSRENNQFQNASIQIHFGEVISGIPEIDVKIHSNYAAHLKGNILIVDHAV